MICYKRSNIQGYGVFSTRTIFPTQIIDTSYLRKLKHYCGFNHSCDPNAILVRTKDDNVLCIATSIIIRNTEIVVDYDFVPGGAIVNGWEYYSTIEKEGFSPITHKCNCPVCKHLNNENAGAMIQM